jgi:hypothetical protein
MRWHLRGLPPKEATFSCPHGVPLFSQGFGSFHCNAGFSEQGLGGGVDPPTDHTVRPLGPAESGLFEFLAKRLRPNMTSRMTVIESLSKHLSVTLGKLNQAKFGSLPSWGVLQQCPTTHVSFTKYTAHDPTQFDGEQKQLHMDLQFADWLWIVLHHYSEPFAT